MGARDAHAEIVAFDLDLGEILFVQQFRDGADQVLIHIEGFAHMFTVSSGQSVCQSSLGKCRDGQSITGRAKAANDPERNRRYVRVMAEGFPRKDI